MRNPLAIVLILLLASVGPSWATTSDGARGAFTVTAVDVTGASDCATSDGEIRLTFDAVDFGTAPYDISTDNGATYAVAGATLDAANQVTIGSLRSGAYAIAVRDAGGDVVYPGYARIRGCEVFACSPLADEFHVDPVAGATGYAWSTDIGTVASGQNTTSVKLDLTAQLPNSVGELCVQPTGPGCTAPPTCFELRVRCPEICDNGIDDDLDGDVDCADGGCAQPAVAITTAPAGDVCAGRAVTFRAGDAGAGHTYAWSFGSGASPATATGAGPHTVSFTAVGTATVRVDVDNLGCTGFEQRTVQITASPTPSIAVTESSGPVVDDGRVCAGYTTTLVASGGASYSWSTGETTARIDPSPTATTTYTVTASSPAGCSAQTDVTVVVEDIEDPAFANTPATQTFACDRPRPLPTVTATDGCGGGTPVITRDSTITDICGEGYEIVRVWTATDASGNTSTISQLVVVQDTRAPTFTGTPADLVIDCSDAFPRSLPSVSDNCQSGVAIAERTEIEPGACADSYVHVRVFVATDDCGNATEARQRVTVSDTEGPRFARVPEDVELPCGQAIPSSSVEATDACDVNVSVRVSEIGETNATGCRAQPAIRRIWTATDNCGNVSTASQLITFRDDGAPALVDVPRVTTLDCTDPLDFAPPTSVDNCDTGVVVTYEDATTAANCGLDIVRTWIATDACGNETREDQEIYVRDLTPPVFTTSVSDARVACGEALPELAPRGVDACDPAPVLTYDEFEAPLTGGSCAAEKQVYRQWTLTDACGNLATLQQIVTVTDQAGPVFSNVPLSADVACADYDASAEQPTVADGCGGAVSVVEQTSESQRVRGTELLTVKLRTWTATDACGNTSSATQEIVFAPGAPTILASTVGGLLSSGTETCAGELLTLTAPSGADRYTWSTGQTTETIQVRAKRTQVITVGYRGSGSGACAGQASYTLRVGRRPCTTVPSLLPCGLSSVDTRTVCNDNGTPGLLADDTYAVFATLRGTPQPPGQTFRISGDVAVSTAYVGSEIKLGEFPYTRTSLSFDAVGSTDPNCAKRGLTVASPGACGSGCELAVLAVEAGPCAGGQFDLSVRLAFANPAGALRVNGKRFVLTGQFGERTLVLPNLSCTGDQAPLKLTFEGDTSCSLSTTYDAACPGETCLPLAIEFGTP